MPKALVFRYWRAMGPFLPAFLLTVMFAGCGCIFGSGKHYKVQIGTASWYGREYHGRKTSSGEIFDMYKLTAAHNELPLGTIVKVTNLKNGKSVTVRINDRGPFVGGRVIDLSYAAARRIGMLKDGVARVRIEIVG